MSNKVSIKIIKMGYNLAVCHTTLGNVYEAVKYEPFEEDEQGDAGVDKPYYVYHDDTGDRVGLIEGYRGVVIQEV